MGQLVYRVLIVDDDNLFRRALAGALLAAGYVVRTATDGLGAIGELRGGLPDVIVSDLCMPRMSGSEFLAVVRHRFPQTPVIAISGAATSEGIPEGLAADAFLQKDDLVFEDVLRLTSDLISKRQTRTADPRPGFEPVEAKADGDSNYVITCAECLRPFRVHRDRLSARGTQTTACDQCGGVTPFLVVDRQMTEPETYGTTVRSSV